MLCYTCMPEGPHGRGLVITLAARAHLLLWLRAPLTRVERLGQMRGVGALGTHGELGGLRRAASRLECLSFFELQVFAVQRGKSGLALIDC